MGLFSSDKNVGEGDESTGGLPKRLNKKERQADQARAARIERDSFAVRTDRDKRLGPGHNPGGYDYDREQH
jgi:hypothetical protein